MKIKYMMINSYVTEIHEIDVEPLLIDESGLILFELEHHQCPRCGGSKWFYCPDTKVPFLACYNQSCMISDREASKNKENSVNLSYQRLRDSVGR